MRCLLILGLCCLCSRAEETDSKQPSLTELYQQLASSDFVAREAATEALIRRGPAVVAELESLRKTDTDPERVARCKTIARLAEFGACTTIEAIEKLRVESLKAALARKHPAEDEQIVKDLARIDRIIQRAVNLAPEKDKMRVEGEAQLATGIELYKLCKDRDQFWIRLANARLKTATVPLEYLTTREPHNNSAQELLQNATMLRYATQQMLTAPVSVRVAPHE